MLLDPVDVAAANDDIPPVRLVGEMDLATAPAMLDRAHELVELGHRHIRLDMAAVEFCDSQGLRAVIGLLEAVQPDGSVSLLDPSATVVELFTITGLIDRFLITVSH